MGVRKRKLLEGGWFEKMPQKPVPSSLKALWEAIPNTFDGFGKVAPDIIQGLHISKTAH
jgi:hypothetical protein